MIKLPELAEQATFVADWYGADWSSALCQDKDGNQAHEIICESREESVISTGSNSNEASWLCDYLEMCSPENIIVIAKYVAELEQRLNATAQPVSDDLYRIANHIAGAKNSLPQEWQDWAEEIESDLRKLAAAPGGQDD